MGTSMMITEPPSLSLVTHVYSYADMSVLLQDFATVPLGREFRLAVEAMSLLELPVLNLQI
jgi:hypothetical protein